MKVIRFIILAILGCLSLQAYAQLCGTPAVNLSTIEQTDPMRYQLIMQMEQQIANFTSQQSAQQGSDEIYTIPVVIHIIHNGESRDSGLNISDAQINSQIEVLTDDFRRMNADAGNTPSEFQGDAADTKIQFILACGGVTRRKNETSTLEFDIIDWGTLVSISPAWDTNKYLNIWVCDIAGTLLGWASHQKVVRKIKMV